MAKHDAPPPVLFDPNPSVAITGCLVLLDLVYEWRVIQAGLNNWTAQVSCGFRPCEIVPSEIVNRPSQAKASAAAERVIRRHNRTVHNRPEKRELRWTH
jgi:hypothetical protein